jgi:hypothetical protein
MHAAWIDTVASDPQELPVAYPSAFELKSSNLNAFLFASIGAELNGSDLTMLSMLARLGQDPWAEASRLSRLPSADALKSLLDSLGKMPLGPQAVQGLGANASRLLALLPGQTAALAARERPQGTPPWLPIAILGGVLALGLFAAATLSTTAQVTEPALQQPSGPRPPH